MLSIFATTDHIETVLNIIQSEDRLSELVTVYDSFKEKPISSGHVLIIDQRGILQPLDWQNFSPPYLLSQSIAFSRETLLALIFCKLGNAEKAWAYSGHDSLFQAELNLLTLMQQNYIIKEEVFQSIQEKANLEEAFTKFRMLHNTAILYHYGFLNGNMDGSMIVGFYQQAYDSAPNDEYKAFTIKQFATLLLDVGEMEKAVHLLKVGIQGALSEDALYSLKSILIEVWMKKLIIPYDQSLLETLKETLWETLAFFESNNQEVESGLLLLHATHIATISESYAEAMGYVNKAIQIFEKEQLVELVGQGHIKKGTLFYTWAQHGSPQFYKPAIESYQQALKVFPKERMPHIFAEIHHHLGVIYAEMPSETKKKSILAGVAVSSFNEALAFYTKESYPYEYGMICNNFGNAFTKFPQAVLSDNFEKSLFYYQEALEVRGKAYPNERVLTLLNFLEASWKVGNDSEQFNEDRYQDMLTKANEIKLLTDQSDLLQEAEKHLELLYELKRAAAQS